MGSSDTCRTCRFYDPFHDADYPDGERGECRFLPPTVLLGRQGVFSVHPQVDHDGWCGQHSPTNEVTNV